MLISSVFFSFFIFCYDKLHTKMNSNYPDKELLKQLTRVLTNYGKAGHDRKTRSYLTSKELEFQDQMRAIAENHKNLTPQDGIEYFDKNVYNDILAFFNKVMSDIHVRLMRMQQMDAQRMGQPNVAHTTDQAPIVPTADENADALDAAAGGSDGIETAEKSSNIENGINDRPGNFCQFESRHTKTGEKRCRWEQYWCNKENPSPNEENRKRSIEFSVRFGGFTSF